MMPASGEAGETFGKGGLPPSPKQDTVAFDKKIAISIYL